MAPERFYLHPSASRDLREATKRYRERDQDIAADFVKAVRRRHRDDRRSAPTLACQDWLAALLPEALPVHRRFREAGELIEIGAVAHQKRRPDYWPIGR